MPNISLRVRNLIEKYGTSNPFKICSYLKINIIYSDLGSIKGYYKKCLRKKFIILNENLNEFDKKLVVSHELGHTILHNDKNISFMKRMLMPKNSIYEQQANLFAKELLKEDLEYIYSSSINFEILEDIKKLK